MIVFFLIQIVKNSWFCFFAEGKAKFQFYVSNDQVSSDPL